MGFNYLNNKSNKDTYIKKEIDRKLNHFIIHGSFHNELSLLNIFFNNNSIEISFPFDFMLLKVLLNIKETSDNSYNQYFINID